MIRFVLAVALLAIAPATVRADEIGNEHWTTTVQTARPKAVDITAPREAGGLRLTRLQNVRNSPVDVYASYASQDGAIFSTLHVYRAAHPDPTYGMRMTTRAILGSNPQASAQDETLAVVAGTPALRRRAFTGSGRDATGYSLAGLLRAGDWMVKLRVTGPGARRAEVDAAFDALIAGLTFGPGVRPQAAPLETVSSCPEPANLPSPRPIEAPGADFGAILRRGVNAHTAGQSLAPRRLCSMAIVDLNGSKEIVSEEGLGAPRAMLLSDAGDALVVLSTRAGSTTAWWLVVAVRNEAQLYGPYDRAPSAAALADVVRGSESWSGALRASLTRDAEGRIQITTP